jgi:NADPH-dependent 2,4-dienoyl-CoA reductase/sulfur reductase-like enzyme
LCDRTLCEAVVIGAGPAGLMAAETLALAGVQVDVFDAMPSVGRKFLLAGKGGLNLTHSEAFEPFLGRYAERAATLRPLLQGEPAADGRIALRLEDWQRLEPILAALREAGCRIEEMELAHTDLEDVFLKIMAAEPGFQPARPAAGGAGAACLQRTAAPENV